MPISINDILVTIPQFLNHHLTGFNAGYAECDNKKDYVEKCKYLVRNAWTSADESSEAISDFFTLTLKPLLAEPSKTVFQNKQHYIQNRDVTLFAKKQKDLNLDTTASLFARYALMRAIFKLYEQEKSLIDFEEEADLHWFMDSKKLLDEQFDELCQRLHLTYNGVVIETRQQLQASMENQRAIMNTTNYYLTPIKYLVLIMVVYRHLEAAATILDYFIPDVLPVVEIEVTPQVQQVIAALYLAAMLYGFKLIYDQTRAYDTYRFFSRNGHALIPQEVQNNANVQKFIFLRDDEIKKLFSTTDTSSNQETRVVLYQRR
jgi:hypothetical protein